MFQRNEFKAVLARKKITMEAVANALKLNAPTFSRKINGQSDFYRNEIETLLELRGL